MTDAAAIFLNRAAAAGRSARTRDTVELARAALDADLHVIETRDPTELAGWLEERAREYRTVVVAGGDGTLAGAYNVLAGAPDVVLGYLPAGFGNASSRLLRLPPDPPALVEVLLRGDARPVDLVDAGGRLALFAGAGWDALVAERYAAAGARRTVGWGLAIAGSLPDLARRRRVVVEADGVEIHRGPMELLVAGTTPWYGRGLLVNPGARPDAGTFTVRIYAGPLPAFAAEAARWIARRRPAAPPHRATRLTLQADDGDPIVVQADGDALGRRAAWTFAVRPRAVRLIGAW